jgi:hypothetical protein
MTNKRTAHGEVLQDVVLNRRFAVSLAAGVLSGFWAAGTPRVLARDLTVLATIAGAAVGLLAVTLAAMALLATFLQGFYGRAITELGIEGFFRPFRIVAAASAVAALASLAGMLDSSAGSRDVRSAILGAAICFIVWAITGTVVLVGVVVRYAKIGQEFERHQWNREAPRRG